MTVHAAHSGGESIVDHIFQTYFKLRSIMTGLGILFPVTLLLGLWIGAGQLLDSLSAYYGSGMQDLFVGGLWAIAACLFAYRGVTWPEEILLDLAAIFAIGVAIFPFDGGSVLGFEWGSTQTVHYISAVGFFICIAIVAIAQGTYSGRNPASKNKSGGVTEQMAMWRSGFEKLYFRIGLSMVAILVLALIFYFVPNLVPRWVLLIEIAAILLFAFYWFIKTREIQKLRREYDDNRAEMTIQDLK